MSDADPIVTSTKPANWVLNVSRACLQGISKVSSRHHVSLKLPRGVQWAATTTQCDQCQLISASCAFVVLSSGGTPFLHTLDRWNAREIK